jgi:hypothetical protein
MSSSPTEAAIMIGDQSASSKALTFAFFYSFYYKHKEV